MSPLTSSSHGTCAQLQQFQVTPGWDMTLWYIFDAVCFDRSPVFHVRPLVFLRSLLNIQSKWRPFFRIVMRSLDAIMSVSYHLKVSNPWQSLLQADTQSEITCPHDTATLCNACWPKFWQWRRNLSCIQASHRVCDTNHRILWFQSLPLQWNIRKRTQGRHRFCSGFPFEKIPETEQRLKIIEDHRVLLQGCLGCRCHRCRFGCRCHRCHWRYINLVVGWKILGHIGRHIQAEGRQLKWLSFENIHPRIASCISATNIMTVVTS